VGLAFNRLAGHPRETTPVVWLLPALAAWIGLGAVELLQHQSAERSGGQRRMEEDAVYYEKTYKKYEGIAQPHYTDIRFTIDLVPANAACAAWRKSP
jgi:hypothetical protein